MATNSKAGYASVQPEFLVTYGTGGIKSPSSLRPVSLSELQQILLTQHQAETEALHELSEPINNNPLKEAKWRLTQQQRVKESFPFVVPQAAFDEEAYLDDKNENDWAAGWRRRSNLVAFAFRYAVKGNAKCIARARECMAKQLLATPLLGPSIELMFKTPGECILNVFIFENSRGLYCSRKALIKRYFRVTNPELYQALVHHEFYGDHAIPCEKYMVGFDPLAYLRPRTAHSVVFPLEQAVAVLNKAVAKRR